MKRVLFITLIYISSSTNIFGQSLPIGIDGRFNDWDNSAHYTDPQGDGGDYDLLSFSVSNDSTYLFVRFVIQHGPIYFLDISMIPNIHYLYYFNFVVLR